MKVNFLTALLIVLQIYNLLLHRNDYNTKTLIVLYFVFIARNIMLHSEDNQIYVLTVYNT